MNSEQKKVLVEMLEFVRGTWTAERFLLNLEHGGHEDRYSGSSLDSLDEDIEAMRRVISAIQKMEVKGE